MSDECVNRQRNEFVHAKELMLATLDTTPDDRINWSPSPTSRSPLQLVSHAASVVKLMHDTWDGQPFPDIQPKEADASMRDAEMKCGTREEVVAKFNENCDSYLQWLDNVTPEKLDKMINLPFGPEAPVSFAIQFTSLHMNSHTAQMQYIQTIYGDREWR